MTTDRHRSFKSILLGLTAAAAFLLPAAVQAAEGFATANVNMRSGPSTRYPAVTVIPVGTSVEIHGCLSGIPWCDVSFYNGRGWVAGRYVQAEYRQDRVYLEPQYYGTLGIPTVTFELGNYWDRNYRNRSFYRDRDYWRRGDGDRIRDRDRPRRDVNERPRRNNDNDIIIVRPGRDNDDNNFDRPRRDRDRDRVERRREQNEQQLRNDRDNRRDRERQRIERRNNDNDNDQRIERRNDRQDRNRADRNRDGENRYRNGEINGRKIGGPQGGDDGDNGSARCRPGDTNCGQ